MRGALVELIAPLEKPFAVGSERPFVIMIAGVNGAGLAKLKAGELISQVASQVNGKGGGRPDMAQGGGDDVPALIPALAGVVEFAKAKIG